MLTRLPFCMKMVTTVFCDESGLVVDIAVPSIINGQ